MARVTELEGAWHDHHGSHLRDHYLIIGALGRLVVPGRQPIPIWLTIVIGIIASFVGSFIAGALGYANSNGGIPWILLILQVIVAAIGVVVAANLYARRGTARR